MNRVLILCLLSSTFVKAQSNNFDGPNTLPVVIENLSGNIWQKGEPQKTIFQSARSLPNALVTDTVSLHPVPNLSTAYLKIENAYGHGPDLFAILNFYHKIDMDSNHAGAWLEYSIDTGATWHNAFSDSLLGTDVYSGTGSIDTLSNGQIGITGTDTSWSLFTICWGNNYNPPMPTIDSAIWVRFVFWSDPSASPAEGWMIDDVGLLWLIVDDLSENSDFTDQTLLLYPNPSSGNLYYEISSDISLEDCRIHVWDSKGDLTLDIYPVYSDGKIDLNQLSKGVYLITLNWPEGESIKRIVKK